ncbi:hypothetical protein ABIF79_008161 [Bradyrhizobium japonicum]|nr:DUF1906 domain-containing protein [Bradyrhizobium liaoningense]
MSKPEQDALVAAGLKIVTIWENKTEQDLADGLSDGIGDALKAISLATNQPSGSAIYFAVDNNFPVSTVEKYFHGVMSVFNDPAKNPKGLVVGVYGSEQACSAALSEGAIYAWDWTNSGTFNWTIDQIAKDDRYSNNSSTSDITTLDPTGALPVDALFHHQITVEPSVAGDKPVYGVDIDVVKAGTSFGAFGPGAPAPDLQISTASLVTSSLIPGGGGTIAYTVSNAGGGASPSQSVSQIYLSTSGTLDASARLVSVVPLTDPMLAPGASQSDVLPFTLPANLAPGKYNLIVSADDGHVIPESNENNNTYAIPITIGPSITTINTLSDLLAALHNWNSSGRYVLGANIDATGFTVAPIGSSTSPFTGTFDGNGHTINGLHVVGNGTYVGLFAEVGSGGKISNLGLTNLSVSAPRGYDVGGLVGRNLGTIENSYTSGTISGTAGNFVSGLNGIAIGGVAGWNFGTIKNSYSSATITSDSIISVDLGGLAGGNSGMIDHSHASGMIKGHSGAYGTGLVEIGGLVGSLGFGATGGKIQNSYATGSVVSDGSNTAAGGLVGASVSSSTIFQSYATGSVSTGGPSWDGGLVGILFNGTISQSFAKGSVTVGNGGDAGGLVGQMNAGTIFESYAKGATTGSTGTDVAGLVAHSYGGAINQSYATGKVTATPLAIAGGLVAQNDAVITNSYWDTQSTGQLTSAGGGTLGDFFPEIGDPSCRLRPISMGREYIFEQ